MTSEDLARTYAAAWLERHATKRLKLLRDCCAEDVRFVQQGQDDEIVGVESLSEGIGLFQASWPTDGEVTVELTSAVDEHHGFGRGSFVWKFPDGDGHGTDFVELSDGKMKTIVVFGDPPPADEFSRQARPRLPTRDAP